MREKITYLLILSFLLLMSFSVLQNKPENIKLISTNTQFEVGNTIVLKFSSPTTTKPLLYCSSSYGSTLLSPIIKEKAIHFKIPKHISDKIGVVNWQLLNTNQALQGSINIKPKLEVATMETYIGPPSIEAGGTDFTMLVVIPTDSLDNPVPENTLVKVNHQFLEIEKDDNINTKNLIAYKNIYSYKKSGRLLVSSRSLNTDSKEFTVNVTPAIPTSFSISADRPHQYADGNQITTLSTSIIKDKHNNVVSDGTYVSFIIEDIKGHILKSVGSTINGVATSRIVHPDKGSNWSIKAYIDGISNSDSITLNYKQAVEDFKITFSDDGRTINVGPIKSFMQQLIPDGLQVKLQVYNDQTPVEVDTQTTFNGFTKFTLKPEVIKKGNYTLSIEAAGITKTINNKQVW